MNNQGTKNDWIDTIKTKINKTKKKINNESSIKIE